MPCAARWPRELAQLRDDISRLMQAAVDAGTEALEDGDAVVISGERKLLDRDRHHLGHGPSAQDVRAFRKKTDLLQLPDSIQPRAEVQIYIGGDSQLVPLEEVPVITRLRRRWQGGRYAGRDRPHRMSYERVILIVDITARLLSNALSHNSQIIRRSLRGTAWLARYPRVPCVRVQVFVARTFPA